MRLQFPDVSQGKRKENLTRAQLQVELGRDVTDQEVKDALGRERNLSNRVKFAPTSSLSLDEPLMEDGDQTLGDLLSEEELSVYTEKTDRCQMTLL